MSTLLARIRTVVWTAPAIALATALMGSVSLAISLFDASGNAQHRVARGWSRVLLWIARVEVEVEGTEQIAPGGSYVFVANHRSFFDIPCILPHISVQFRFLADKHIFSVPFIGYHLTRAGHIPVTSSSARESLKTMSAAAKIVHDRGISVLIFPEGERTHGETLPFKDGAAYIAIKAGVPIVPISLVGARKILPRGGGVFRGGAVRMRIGRPVPTLDVPLNSRTELSAALRDTIMEYEQSAGPTQPARNASA